MTPQEINEAVARKLGWKDNYPVYQIKDPAYRQILSPPDYCGDIRAAWEIVERIQLSEYLVKVIGKRQPEYTFFACEIRTYKPEEKIIVMESADTAPMAICLAFLKLEEIKLDRKG